MKYYSDSRDNGETGRVTEISPNPIHFFPGSKYRGLGISSAGCIHCKLSMPMVLPQTRT